MANYSSTTKTQSNRVYTVEFPTTGTEITKMASAILQDAMTNGYNTNWDDFFTWYADDEHIYVSYKMDDNDKRL